MKITGLYKIEEITYLQKENGQQKLSDRVKLAIKKLLKKIPHLKNSFLCMKAILNRPSTIILDVGSSCNAQCPFCSRGVLNDKPSLPNGIMNQEIFEIIFNQLRKMKHIKNVRLYAFGEPLLNKDIGYYIKKLKSINKTVILSTNTTNLNKYSLDLMDLDVVQFSIEGWDKESYELYRQGLCFEKTLNNLKLFDETIKKYRKQGKQTPIRKIHLLINKNTKLEKFIELWQPFTDEIRIDIMYPAKGWDYNKNIITKIYNENFKDAYFSLKKKLVTDICPELHNITLNSHGEVVLCCVVEILPNS